ncbi:MAG: TlpA family protein disulfide reductase [Muricoprocola sp.]
MNKKRNFVIILLLFVLLLGGASVLYAKLGQKLTPDQLAVQEQTETEKESEETNEEESDSQQDTKAPDFTVYDIEGNAVHLSAYIGKPVVLNFWASWCGPCKMEIPDFEEKYLETGETIQFLLINLTDGSRETIETASDYIESEGYTLPVFYDTDSDAANTYQVYSIPTTYFIDSEGNLIAQATGAIDGETLQKGIDMITE